MSGALWYLIRASARNRLRRQAARLRQPRYAAAFAMGLLYFWFFFLRPGRTGMPGEGVAVMLGVFAVVILGYLAWAWLFGTDRTALAFTRAEVALLFPAPITRRGLILYKLARSQFGILFSVVIWSVLLNRGGSVAGSLMRGAGLWVALTTFSLHRLGIGLLRAGAEEHGASGVRRGLPAMLVFASALALVGGTLRAHWDWVRAADDAREAVQLLLGVLDLPPAAWVLYPIRVAFAPIAERELLPWLAAVTQALMLLALHVWWVLGSDRAFEEAAAEASERQAKWVEEMRTRRGGGAVVNRSSRRRSLRLASRGAPEVAIVWKNALWLLRTHQLRGILLPPLLLLGATLAFAGRGGDLESLFAAFAAGLAFVFMLFGPASMRNDLRSDLLNLPLLKTLPIPGRRVVLAQVLSGALTITLPQLLLVGVALVALALDPGRSPVPARVLLAGTVAAPGVLLALNTANFALHNGVALLYPGWVRLGERGPTGIEATGQMMLTSLATFIALALLLVLPAVAGAIGWVAAGAAGDPATSLLVALLAGAAVLAAEAVLMVNGLGRAFERVEPTQVAG